MLEASWSLKYACNFEVFILADDNSSSLFPFLAFLFRQFYAGDGPKSLATVSILRIHFNFEKTMYIKTVTRF